jgi:hypothetical protein
MAMRRPDPIVGSDADVRLGHCLLYLDAQQTAATTLANSARMPSPVISTIWPCC